MDEEIFERYRKLIMAMKRNGIVKSASDGYAMLVQIQRKKGLSHVELLNKLGF